MAEVAHALRQALRSKTERAMFIEIYRGTLSGQRLRRGFARLLNDMRRRWRSLATSFCQMTK